MRVKPIWFVEPALSVLSRSDGFGGETPVIAEEKRTRSSDEQYEALLSGSADLAITAMDNVIAWNARGEADDFRIVGQVEETTILSIMTRRGFHAEKGLSGASILVDAPGNGFIIVLRAFLADIGAPAGDDQLMVVGGVKERCDALLAGQGDITLLGPPFDTTAATAGASVLARIQDRYPTFPGQGIVSRRSTVGSSRSALSSWLKALDDTRRQVSSDISAARAAFKAAGLTEAAADKMLTTLPASLMPNRAGVELLIQQRSMLGLPGGHLKYEELVDSTLLAAVL